MAEIRMFHDCYQQAEAADNLGLIEQSLHSLMDAIFTCAYLYGIPLDAVFAEVHRSNMAKCVDGVVLRRADGKVRKPPGWTPPDIRAVLFATASQRGPSVP